MRVHACCSHAPQTGKNGRHLSRIFWSSNDRTDYAIVALKKGLDPPPVLSREQMAEFLEKAKAIAPKYHIELLGEA